MMMLGRDSSAQVAVTVWLLHREMKKSVPLYVGFDTDLVVARWQRWAKALGLPELIADSHEVARAEAGQPSRWARGSLP